MYVSEAKAILKQSAEKYDFLNDVDEKYGISNIEKIIQILEFRVPYFVGPIGECREGQKHSWAERQSNIEYKPWTLSQIVDLDKAEDEFINRMTNKCTYLRDKDVLPKNSILYAKFRVLNELNNLTINGQKISVDIKQLIFTNLFEKYKKVTINRVKDLLAGEGLLSKDEAKTVVIGGIDKDFANNYAPYVNIVSSQNFTKEFVDKNIDMFEEIIKYHTIISDKNRLAQRIKNKFGNVLNDIQIKEVKGWNYQGWGNLSREFLTLPFADKKDGLGVATNIIETMWTTNQNMQQIIFNSNYTLEEELDSLKEKGKTDLLYEDVEKLYCSPAVKRGVWQSIKIIKEIRDVMGSMPEKIFVEVTREDKEKGDKGRKDSRLTNLQEIYKSKEFKESTKAVAADIANLQNELNHKENNALRSEKLYLYFLQMGKCMYSGEPINIEDVANDKMYDIDHIIPQSIIKDDSIDNKVLVKSEYNRVKDNAYPIYSTHPQWVNKMKSYWKMLKDLKLISTKKYDNLIRIDDLAEEELSGFIARQLVETNQSAKAVLDLLKTIVDDPTKVVYSKAKFVSDFRNNHKIYKSRTVNDLHHAKDAYLNIVVGNVINSRFTSDPKNFYRKRNKNSNKTKNMNKLFDYGSVIYSPVTDEVVWDTNRDIERIKSTCFDNSCMVTKMSYSKLNGAYYDETVYKSAKNNPKSKAKVQLKGDTKNPISSVEKYGGYNSQNNSYFMVIEGEKKGKPIKVIESVPILMYQTYKNDKDFNDRILEHLAKENGISNARIVLPKVNFQSTLKIDNGLYWLSGSSGDMRLLYNANQWFVDNDTTRYVKALEKYSEIKKNRKDGDLKEIDGRVVLSPASKKNNTEIILSKVENEQLYHAICGQLSKDIYKGLQLDTGLREKMVSCEGDFCGKSVLEQAQLLLGVLNGVSTGAAMADMSILNESKFVGKLLINKNIANKDISLIIQSPTGLYTEEIKL